MANEMINDQWLSENTVGVDTRPGGRVVLAVVTEYEIGTEFDPVTGARMLHKVGASGKASKNGRPVKARGVQQAVRVAAVSPPA